MWPHVGADGSSVQLASCLVQTEQQVQLPTSANNVTLLAFAADFRATVDVGRKVPVAAPAADAPCSNRSTSPARGTHSSKPAAAACSGRMMGQTDRQTDGQLAKIDSLLLNYSVCKQ